MITILPLAFFCEFQKKRVVTLLIFLKFRSYLIRLNRTFVLFSNLFYNILKWTFLKCPNQKNVMTFWKKYESTFVTNLHFLFINSIIYYEFGVVCDNNTTLGWICVRNYPI